MCRDLAVLILLHVILTVLTAGARPESEEQRRLVVRQSYPFKTNGAQECEGSRALMRRETSRLVTSEGTVVKFMTDGTVIVSTISAHMAVFLVP